MIEDPVLRQRLDFRRTTDEDGGEVLHVEMWVDPGGGVPPHIHPAMEERFEVLEGTPSFLAGRKWRTASAGETVVAPAGVRHAYRNRGEETAHIVCHARPPSTLQEFLEETAALGRAGKLTRRGALPNSFDALVRAVAWPNATATWSFSCSRRCRRAPCSGSSFPPSLAWASAAPPHDRHRSARDLRGPKAVLAGPMGGGGGLAGGPGLERSGLIVNPDFAVGDDATAETVLGVDMNGWHAVSGFLIAVPGLLVATRPYLAAVFSLFAAGGLIATGVWALFDTQVAGGLFSFPNNETDAFFHFGVSAIFLAGAAHYFLVERPSPTSRSRPA